jgi:hypothetical protein
VRTVFSGGGVADVVLWLARKVLEEVVMSGRGGGVEVGGRNPLKIRAKL